MADDDYLLLSVGREHEHAWMDTARGVAHMTAWCSENGLPPPTMICAGSVEVWQTAAGMVVRYETFVPDRQHGGWARDSRGLPRRQACEAPYRFPLPEGIGTRHDRLPFPPVEPPEDVQCEGQLAL